LVPERRSGRGVGPLFAKDVLHTGPEGLGTLMMANGIGSVIGSIAIVFEARAPALRRL
jgi:hypothetical protein